MMENIFLSETRQANSVSGLSFKRHFELLFKFVFSSRFVIFEQNWRAAFLLQDGL